MTLDDLFNERITYLAKYCAREEVYIVLWTQPGVLTSEQYKRALKERQKMAIEKRSHRFEQRKIYLR